MEARNTWREAVFARLKKVGLDPLRAESAEHALDMLMRAMLKQMASERLVDDDGRFPQGLVILNSPDPKIDGGLMNTPFSGGEKFPAVAIHSTHGQVFSIVFEERTSVGAMLRALGDAFVALRDPEQTAPAKLFVDPNDNNDN